VGRAHSQCCTNATAINPGGGGRGADDWGESVKERNRGRDEITCLHEERRGGKEVHCRKTKKEKKKKWTVTLLGQERKKRGGALFLIGYLRQKKGGGKHKIADFRV